MSSVTSSESSISRPSLLPTVPVLLLAMTALLLVSPARSSVTVPEEQIVIVGFSFQPSAERWDFAQSPLDLALGLAPSTDTNFEGGQPPAVDRSDALAKAGKSAQDGARIRLLLTVVLALATVFSVALLATGQRRRLLTRRRPVSLLSARLAAVVAITTGLLSTAITGWSALFALWYGVGFFMAGDGIGILLLGGVAAWVALIGGLYTASQRLRPPWPSRRLVAFCLALTIANATVWFGALLYWLIVDPTSHFL